MGQFNKFQFFKDMGYVPHAGQLKVHLSKAPRRVMACGVRWGKTRCAAMEGLAAAMEPRPNSMGWVVAPTYDLADKVFREIVLLVATHLSHRLIQIKDSERRLFLRNMAGGKSEIRCRTADNPMSLLGEGLDWLIVDEAAQLKPIIWEQYLSQRLLDRKGWALFISTPKGKGWFYDLWRQGQQGRDSDFESWNFPSWDNPLLDKTLIDREKLRLPERAFLEQYGGEFLEGSGSVFRRVRDYATGKFQEPIQGKVYYGGLDLAKSEDFTVLVILNDKKEVVFVDRFNRQDWPTQIARIQASTQRYSSCHIYIDSTGLGDPILSSLQRAGCWARGYAFTQASKGVLIDSLILDLEGGKITLPTPQLWPQGIDELERFEFSLNDLGNYRTGAPYGYHDDCVIALALANYCARWAGNLGIYVL